MRAFLILVIVVCAIGVVGTMDAQDGADQSASCAEMVKEGYWPKEVCE